MTTKIVLGLCYGDEGKGQIASYLAGENDLIVRFNGGSQAGHTVTKNGYRHIFSSFGAGTLNGAHTYWSEYCAFYPKSFYNERKALLENGFKVVHYIHPLSPVITPFDIDFNRSTEKDNQHGSVGMGFGATVHRTENTPYKLYAVDLTYREILIHKLRQIAAYYQSENAEKQIETFLKYVDAIHLNICTLAEIKNDYENIIFEGAQGIMLDMDFGYFPNVTRSNCTSKNAMQIIKDNDLPVPEVYYCMRSYLTRHGNGFMPNETGFNFEDLTNITHKYQGNFRQGYHSFEQLKYALNCDCIYSGYDYSKKHLSIICLDQTEDKVLIDHDSITVEELLNKLPPFKNLITSPDSSSPISKNKPG